MFLILSVYIGLFFLYPIITTPLIMIPLTYRFKYSKIFLILFVLGISLITLRYIPFPTDDGAYHYKAAYLYQSYDSIFYNKNSMSVQQIQNFLDWQIGHCDIWGTEKSGYGNLTNAQYAQQVKGWQGPPYSCINTYHENPNTGETSFEKGGGWFEGGISAAQMAAKMHWDYRAKNFEEFPNNQKWFATGEALANLEHLRAIGKADYEFKDGVAYYRVKK